MRQLLWDNGTIKAFPIIEATYARLSVGTSFPSSPLNNDLFWQSDQNKLFRYVDETGQWYEINWQGYVKNSPDWVNGKLRINSTTGKLEISPDGTNWYECVPALGAPCIEIMTIDTTSYSYKYFILPGQRIVFRNSNHIPIVFSRGVEFELSLNLSTTADEDNVLLYINGTAITTYMSEIYKSNLASGSVTNTCNGHKVGWVSNEQRRIYSNYSICIHADNHITSSGVTKYYETNAGVIISTNYSVSSSAYWLGTLVTSKYGNIRTATFITVQRRM